MIAPSRRQSVSVVSLLVLISVLMGFTVVGMTPAVQTVEDSVTSDTAGETPADNTSEQTTVGPDFEILDADMPVGVNQSDNITVEFTIENVGTFGTQQVNFTAYAPDDGDEELINASVAVVDDIRNTTQGEAYVDLLENDFETVELVTNDTLLDEMDDYDAFVIYRFVDDTLTEEFLDQLDDDQGVVYLDDMFRTFDERWADGVLRLESARGDPGQWEDVTFDADQQPPEVTITADHPILDGVGDVDETVILNDGTENLPWGSWFEEYSGEVIAEVDYAASDPEQWGGPGIGVNDAENEVLLPALVHENVLEYLTPEGETLVVNAVAHVAPDIDGNGQTATTETDDSDGGNDEFPFFGQEVIHVWDELTLDAGETTTLELEYEVPENLAPALYTQELSTANDSVISELWVELQPDIEVSSYSLDPDPAAEDLQVGETLTAETVLENHGDRPGEFDVEYLVDEDVVATDTVEVDNGTTETVELEHELRESGTKTVSVNGVNPVQIDVEPGPQADIEVTSYTLEPDPAEETLFVGETLAVEANLTNHGELSGAFEVEYLIDEEVISNQTVEVAANSTKSVELDHDLRESGTKIVSVNGVDPVQIFVESEPQADIEVTSYILEPDPAEENLYAGETLTAEAEVTNHGTGSGEFEVEYILDEEVVANQTVEVDANTSKSVELDHELREPGTKIVSVNGVDPVQIIVDDPPEPPSFDLSAVQPGNLTAGPEAPVTAGATITNTGEGSDSTTVELRLEDEAVANESLTLGADENATVSWDIAAPAETGTYNLTVWTETEAVTQTLTVDVPEPLPGFADPQDTTGDGLYNDVTGSGNTTVADVQALFESLGTDTLDNDAWAFGFSGTNPERVNIFDVQALFNRLPSAED